MASFEDRMWTPDPSLAAGSGLSRRDRRGGPYSVYLPDRLVGRRFSFGGAESADVADAERAIADLDRTSTALADTEALARLLLRAESVASSRIEGLHIAPARLLRADVARSYDDDVHDATAAEVLANIDAMAFALSEVSNGARITPQLLLDAHRRLLTPTRIAKHGGHFRTQQNWIGGTDYNPLSAAFVPPPPDIVTSLIDDLCEFCNDDALPTVAQAALAHAQFETIHPFVDGNGRIGRVLVHLVFRRRGLTTEVSPPVSLVLATRSRDYISGLTATRYGGSADSPEANAGVNLWVGIFATACTRAAADGAEFEQRVTALRAAWLERLGSIRKNSALHRIVDLLPGAPVTTVADLQRKTGSALSSVMEAVARLADADIIRPVHPGRTRRQVYEVRDILDAFTDLERQLASPAADTRIAPPIRTVPDRPHREARRTNETTA